MSLEVHEYLYAKAFVTPQEEARFVKPMYHTSDTLQPHIDLRSMADPLLKLIKHGQSRIRHHGQACSHEFSLANHNNNFQPESAETDKLLRTCMSSSL